MTVLVLCLPAHAERVCFVYDGDTLTLCNGMKVRLAGIDAPELKQPYGKAARDYLRALVKDREVRLDCHGKSYKRAVCNMEILLPSGPLHPGRELVGRGLAYDSPKYSKGAFSSAEEFARKLGRGVWAQTGGGVRPWEYRRSQ